MDNNFLVIGLTGPSGVGKTLISNTFLKFNIPIIDADKEAKEVTSPNSPCLKELEDYFGREILNDDGTLKRRHLANIAFSDPEKKEMLNKITHKYIKTNIDNKIDEYKKNGSLGVVLDAPVLIESGRHKKCDKVICVISNKDIRINRIINRDNLSHDEAIKRINAQHDDDFYISNSDYIIINNDNIEDAIFQTTEIIKDIFLKN